MKILVLLAEGFEEIEALTVVDYLRRLDVTVDTVSTTGDKEGEKKAFEIARDDYEAAVIPGGLPGATNLRDDKRVIELTQDFNNREKLVAAICAAPIVLEEAGVIEGKNMTSYPGFEENLKSANYKEEKVVIDGNILTSRGPALAVNFAIEIARYLLGDEKAEELKEDILYRFL